MPGSRSVPRAPFGAALAVAALVASQTQLQPLRAQPDQRYEIVVSKDVMVTMRDGVKLATDIYRPARNGAPVEGRFPVVMERTPYNKDGGAANTAAFFVPRGYVFVVQDVRARYKSEGRWKPIADDPNDGFDTAKWIGSQPWADGIGTVGTSYAGATQHALALANAPNLKTMIPVDAMSNFGRYGVRHNGAFELRWFNWVFTMGNAASNQNALPAALRAASDPAAAPALVDIGQRVREYVRALPLRPGTTPLKFDPRNPVPTLGGNVSSQGTLMTQGAADQRCRSDFWLCADSKPLSTRGDVLVFKRGHRIRLDISSSNFPRFDVNPNTGEPLNDQRRWKVAENSIYHDPQRPSQIVLPIIPARTTSDASAR